MLLSPIARVGSLAVVLLLLCGGCQKKRPIDFSQELPPGQLALRKIDPSQYPDFSAATWNLHLLSQSAQNSLDYLSRPSSRQFFPYLDITHDRAVATLHAFRELAEEAKGQPDPGRFINDQVRSRFEVYKSIGAPSPDGRGYTDRVLFTGYCTPIYEASLTRTDRHRWPLYKRPADLASDPTTGETIGRKLPDGRVEPYPTRREIESGTLLAGQELLWLTSRWEAYVVTVQGSARLRLTDGRIMEIGYAGHNGREYTSPGRQMVADGVIRREDLNLRTLGAYFNANPAGADKYLWMNERTVFFTERPGGPFGSLNVPVTTFASIATDKSVYPRSMPAFLSVPMPSVENPRQAWHFRGFMLDQDTGGAIKAAGRTDIYMGIGPEAERAAGHQLHEGELYYIAIKPELVQRYLPPPSTAAVRD